MILNDIFYIDNFLTNAEFESVQTEFEKYNWKFIAKEESNLPLRTFWQKQMIDSEFLSALFRQKLESIFNISVEVDRLYGNGQAHGQSAWIHKDVDDTPGKWGSLVFFSHKNWKPEYGGHLIFVTEDENNVIQSIFPKTNSAVIFDSSIKHMALEPTVYCKEQRISIAYKFRIK